MDNMRYSIFAKKKDDKVRYWISVPGQTREGADIQASISVILSNDAKAYYKEHAVKTKNEAIKVLRAEITDAWFKAVPGRDYPSVFFFVNEMKEAKKEASGDGSDW